MDKDTADIMTQAIEIIKIKEELNTYEDELKYVAKKWRQTANNEILEPFNYEIKLLQSKNSWFDEYEKSNPLSTVVNTEETTLVSKMVGDR